jgi:Uma2 family endonuclease
MTFTTVKRFTVEEFDRLGELGFFDCEEGVELIHGEIIYMPRKKTPHSVCNGLLWKVLFRLLGDRADLRVQEPIVLSPDSEPQPDVAIVRNRSDNYLSSHPHPEDVFLVIEISDSTLKQDREIKSSLYAKHGISNYWIFNLVSECLEAYSEPYCDRRGNYDYRLKRIFLPDEDVNLPHFPDVVLHLSDIFPLDSLGES